MDKQRKEREGIGREPLKRTTAFLESATKRNIASQGRRRPKRAQVETIAVAAKRRRRVDETMNLRTTLARAAGSETTVLRTTIGMTGDGADMMIDADMSMRTMIMKRMMKRKKNTKGEEQEAGVAGGKTMNTRMIGVDEIEGPVAESAKRSMIQMRSTQRRKKKHLKVILDAREESRGCFPERRRLLPSEAQRLSVCCQEGFQGVDSLV